MDALRQAQDAGVVLGLKDVAGVAPRKDIDKLLVEQPDAFNLFCLALSALMNDADASKIMGYFEIAGIHGLPKHLWDNIGAESKEPGNQDGWGYCVHSSLAFPTWHRPYLAMIEQTIFKKMLDIAETFPEANKATYRAAAKTWRLPHWDYYRPRGKSATFPGVVRNGTTNAKYDFKLPEIFTVESIMLRTPTKNQLELRPNPLQLFDFPKVGSILERDWRIVGGDSATFSRKQTQRYPYSSSSVKSMNDAINKAREQGTSYILNMISDPAYDQYDAFATDSAGTPSSGSLEGIHGNYHVLIGGQSGHMSRVPVAAFDPIFWLHHCQIDRWFAVWQAVHPDAWFDDDQEDLLPFRTSKSPETFWTSRESIDTQTFGYKYPDLVGDPEEVKSTFLNRYSWAVRTARQPRFGTPPPDMEPLDLSKAQVYQYNTASMVHTASNAVINAVDGLQQPVQAVKNTVTAGLGSSGLGPQAATIAVLAALNPDAATMSSSQSNTMPESSTEETSAASERVFANMRDTAQTVLAAPPKVDEDKVGREWFVDNIVERLALNGAFTVYFFIGETPAATQHTSDYLSYPTLAGSSHVFAAPVEACDNCARQDQQAQRVTNTTPITPILLDYMETGELPDLSAASVTPFLEKNLKWRVVTVTGDRVDPRTVSGLKIGISSKLTPLDGQGGITYEEFPDVVRQIIEQSS